MGITNYQLSEKYTDKKEMMESLAKECFSVEKTLADCDSRLIVLADPMALSSIDEKISSGRNLQFEETFAGMLLVLAATNNPIREKLFPEMSFLEAGHKGTGFLVNMAAKEKFVGLSPEEIAGMAAASTLDLVFRPDVIQAGSSLAHVVETCGMGGDRGWNTKEVKTINASTLSGFVLASLGLPMFKHGSFGNTTRVGSTDVPIHFGAKICHHSSAEILDIFRRTNYWFSDAHSVKTLHYLSHLLMMETVNHIIGPMTVPISKKTRLFKVMGVNHHVHPETIAKAYTILHQRGFICLGGALILTGLDEVPKGNEYQDFQWVKSHSFLDEVSPIATLVSLARGKKFIGNFILTHETFNAEPLPEDALKVKNAIAPLMQANEASIRGKNQVLASYLARNASLGLLTRNRLDDMGLFDNLPDYYQQCLEAILSGEAFQTLKNYVEASGGNLKGWP